jgi:hypothetical protein
MKPSCLRRRVNESGDIDAGTTRGGQNRAALAFCPIWRILDKIELREAAARLTEKVR